MTPITDTVKPAIPYQYFDPTNPERAEPEEGTIFTDPGDACHYYEVDGRPYLVLDREDHSEENVFVIDVLARQYYTLTWWLDRINANRKKLSCDCGLLRYDKAGQIEQTCPHYQVWNLYFREFIYEPPEV